MGKRQLLRWSRISHCAWTHPPIWPHRLSRLRAPSSFSESHGGMEKRDLIRSGEKRNLLFWLRMSPQALSAGDLHLTRVSLKSRRTNSQEMQGDSTLPPCRFRGEVATSHQDVTILQQIWHPPWFPSDTSLWQGHVVLQTKSGIYPAGHKQSSSSNGSREGCRAITSEAGLNSENPSVSQLIGLSRCVWFQVDVESITLGLR